MSKINQFSRQTDFNGLRTEINDALKALGVKYGVSIKAGNASYNSELATFKLELTTLGQGGAVETKEAKDFKSHASMYGMKADDLGKTVTIQGRQCQITGLKPRSRNCIIGKDLSSSKSFKLPLAGVKKSLGYEVTELDRNY